MTLTPHCSRLDLPIPHTGVTSRMRQSCGRVRAGVPLLRDAAALASRLSPSFSSSLADTPSALTSPSFPNTLPPSRVRRSLHLCVFFSSCFAVYSYASPCTPSVSHSRLLPCLCSPRVIVRVAQSGPSLCAASFSGAACTSARIYVCSQGGSQIPPRRAIHSPTPA
jgi:hypothetical protein